MPYSSNSGKQVIKTIIQRLDKVAYRGIPLKALDIGCGSGTYPKFINPLMTSKIAWSGIEIWEPYVEQFKLNELYSDISIGSALDVLQAKYEELNNGANKFDILYDLIFVGDVLEHMNRSEAERVLDLCKRLLAPRGMLIVSVPIGEYPQGEYLGNPHEAHIDTWQTIDEFYAVLAHVDPIDWRFGAHAAKAVHDLEIGVGFYTSENIMELLAPRVAAYMICKDEEAFIGRCLESLDNVDEVVICDTGSTDSTIEIIVRDFVEEMDYYPRVQLEKIAVSPWRFDDARNTALGYVSPDIDICISIDADEMLNHGFVDHVKSAWWNSLWVGNPFTRLNHSFMTYWNWSKPDEAPNVSKHYHERIHARFGYHWIHPVHEKLVTNDHERSEWCVDALMIQQPDETKSRSSYGPLLEQAVQEDPTDWKLWSFLSNERSQAGNIDGAISALQECEKQPGADKVFIAWRRASLLEHIGKPRDARRELEKAIELNSFLRESYVLMIELIERNGDLTHSTMDKSLVAMYAEDALSCNVQTQGYLRNEKVWSAEFEEQLKEKVSA